MCKYYYCTTILLADLFFVLFVVYWYPLVSIVGEHSEQYADTKWPLFRAEQLIVLPDKINDKLCSLACRKIKFFLKVRV